jgi:signal transduction histidine kinase
MAFRMGLFFARECTSPPHPAPQRLRFRVKVADPGRALRRAIFSGTWRLLYPAGRIARAMLDEASLHRGSALRERRRVILFCAPVTLLFTFADTLALQRFSPAVFGVRLLWTAAIAGTGLLLGRLSPPAERRLVLGLAVSSPLFFALLTWMTGGFGSPLFHFILAMPLVIAVVLQDHPRATLGAALAMLASGLAIVAGSGQPAAIGVQWFVQAAGMSALAVYASVVYQRLRIREQALRESAALAGERARASEAAVQARDDFLAIASHELRTPLTALRLLADRLVRRSSRSGEAEPTDNGDDRILILHRQVARLSTLVDNLFEMSRLTAGRPALDRQPTAVAPLLRQLLTRYAPVARTQKCELQLEASEDVVAELDANRLEQVLTNLLSNAVKFGAGKPIRVSLHVRTGCFSIAVRDEGIGIALPDQRRIFERFERASSTRNYGGLGLGLWICRRVIEEMGGTIAVDSRPGAGATFTVELPADENDRPRPAAPAQA